MPVPETINGKVQVFTCHRCGSEFTKYRSQVFSENNAFCSRACFIENKKESAHTSVCKECGKRFSVSPCKDRPYCSQQCAGRAKRRGMQKTCPICGTEFYSSMQRKKFCSRACKVANDRKQYVPNVPVLCDGCGKVTYKWPNMIGKFAKSFCSHACRMRYYASGSRNSKWKGGITSLRKRVRELSEYKTWQLTILERDQFTCQLCARKGGILHAHHAIPFAVLLASAVTLVGRSVEAIRSFRPLWNPKNGITVCGACHELIHGNMTGEDQDAEAIAE